MKIIVLHDGCGGYSSGNAGSDTHDPGWIVLRILEDRYRGCDRKDYEVLARERAYFGNFDPFGDFDLIFGAAKQNLKIIETPIHYKARTFGETQIRDVSVGNIGLFGRVFLIAILRPLISRSTLIPAC